MKNIEIKTYTNYDETEILNLYKSVGWSNYYEKPEMLKSGFKNSLFALGAYDGDKLVGIIRVVGDGNTIIYIQDILILPDYQRQQIGTDLLKYVLDKYKDVYQKVLSTDNTEKTISFYQSLGFKKLTDMNCEALMY